MEQGVPFGSQSSWQEATEQVKSNDGEGGEDKRVPGLLMGTATAGDRHKSSIEELLERIKAKPRRRVRDSPDKPALLALLLTPTYAQHALAGDLPLRVLERLQNGEAAAALFKPLDVLTAVVDRLPTPSGPDTGREGLAYMFQRNPTPLSIASQTRLSPSAQKPGSLSFELPPTSERPSNWTIQLPLAQTIFSTGLVSTLVHTRYDYSAEGGLVSGHEQQLESQALRLPLRAEYGVINHHAPLIPLTPFRIVRNHMGNIVRTLSSNLAINEKGKAPSDHSASQPASQELETAVSQYFKAKNLSPEPVQVWALILPSLRVWSNVRTDKLAQEKLLGLTTENIHEAWTGKADQNIIRAMRLGGARLHRVLSGGGGWGKKAGLLSLDPDVAYSSRELRADQGWEFDFDDESEGAVQRQQKQALGEIVAEGEIIMFLIAPSRHHEESSAGGEETAGLSAKEVEWRQRMGYVRKADRVALFGVVPSTIDTVPEDESAVSPSSRKASLRGAEHHPGLFGALSETGMAVSLTHHPNGRQDDARQSTRTTRTTGTKIDVPFNLIRISEADVDAKEAEAVREKRAKANEVRKARSEARIAKLRGKTRAKAHEKKAGDAAAGAEEDGAAEAVEVDVDTKEDVAQREQRTKAREAKKARKYARNKALNEKSRAKKRAERAGGGGAAEATRVTATEQDRYFQHAAAEAVEPAETRAKGVEEEAELPIRRVNAERGPVFRKHGMRGSAESDGAFGLAWEAFADAEAPRPPFKAMGARDVVAKAIGSGGQKREYSSDARQRPPGAEAATRSGT
ncbi:hypothetical protein LTR85_001383 [Meristemomyces frigidus]|nr:hypothetical protein LTR85_001383 [Meristemomyces frigidus]